MKPEMINCLKGYQKKSLISDLTAGLLVAIVALPLSIAFGIQSGSTLQAGLITAIIGGFCISAFGGTRFSIGGPAAAFIVITAGYISTPGIGLPGMLIIVLMSGVLLILMGLLKVGRLLKYVPFPIILGFTAGIGFVLLFGQLKDFLGLTLPNGNPADFIPKLSEYGRNIGSVNFYSLGVGAVTLAIIYGLQKINKKIPGVIIAIVAMTGLTVAAGAIFGDKIHISTIGSAYGDIKTEFTFISAFDFSSVQFGSLILPAIVISLLSALEGLMSATVAEGMTKKAYDANMELVGHGLANIGSGLLGGLPVTGVIARTSVNIFSGGKTPVAGMFHSVLLLVMYFALMPVMKFIPFPVLAAVLIKVAIGMSRFPLLAKFVKFSKRDAAIIAVSFFLTIFLSLIYGVLVGLALAIILNIKNMKRGLKITVEEVKDAFAAVTEALDVEGNPVPELPGEKCFRVSGALYFISVVKLIDFVKKQCADTPEIVLDMSEVHSVDATALEKLMKFKEFSEANELKIELVNFNPKATARYRTAKRNLALSAE